MRRRNQALKTQQLAKYNKKKELKITIIIIITKLLNCLCCVFVGVIVILAAQKEVQAINEAQRMKI